MAKHTMQELYQWQALPLNIKVLMTAERVRNWVNEFGEVVTDYAAMGQCENQMSFADFGIFDKERPLLKTTGCQRTGCVLCGFGCHLEKESRFLRLKETHPKFHNLLYILKNNGVTYAEAIDWVNEHGNMNIKY